MKKAVLPVLLSLVLSACQSTPKEDRNVYTNINELPQTQADFLKRTAAAQEAAKGLPVQKVIYFDAEWNVKEQADPKGFYRESYGLQDNGLYLMQDFFADGRKQTDVFYGVNIESPLTSSVRGYLAVYTPEGKLDAVYFNHDNKQFNRIGFCDDGSMCAEQRLSENGSSETIYYKGKKIDEWSRTGGRIEYEESRKHWYLNGQMAMSLNARKETNRKTTIEIQYRLEDGTLSTVEPATESYRFIKQKIIDTERDVYGREPAAKKKKVEVSPPAEKASPNIQSNTENPTQNKADE